MNAIRTVIIAALALCATGCKSPEAAAEAGKTARAAYNDFITQQRSAETFRVETKEGGTFKFEMAGPASMSTGSVLPPLSARVRDPNVQEAYAAAAERILKFVAGAWAIREVLPEITATRDPVIVEQPAPVIVQPEVVPVGP